MTSARVSIPFKREGVLQDVILKVPYPTSLESVSIPFKREGVLQVNCDNLLFYCIEFQFPSNGKVYCKLIMEIQRDVYRVSIPFKREGVLQAAPRSSSRRCSDDGHVSIPFKREGVLQEYGL